MSKETALKNAELAWRVYTQAYHNTESFEGIGCHLAYLIGGILDGQKLCFYVPLDAPERDFMEMMNDTFDQDDEVWNWIEVTDDSDSALCETERLDEFWIDEAIDSKGGAQ